MNLIQLTSVKNATIFYGNYVGNARLKIRYADGCVCAPAHVCISIFAHNKFVENIYNFCAVAVVVFFCMCV